MQSYIQTKIENLCIQFTNSSLQITAHFIQSNKESLKKVATTYLSDIEEKTNGELERNTKEAFQ